MEAGTTVQSWSQSRAQSQIIKNMKGQTSSQHDSSVKYTVEKASQHTRASPQRVEFNEQEEDQNTNSSRVVETDIGADKQFTASRKGSQVPAKVQLSRQMSEFSKVTAEVQNSGVADRSALFEGVKNKISRNHTNSQIYLNVICSDEEGNTGEAAVSRQNSISKENATNTDNIDTEPGADYGYMVNSGFMVNHYHDHSYHNQPSNPQSQMQSLVGQNRVISKASVQHASNSGEKVETVPHSRAAQPLNTDRLSPQEQKEVQSSEQFVNSPFNQQRRKSQSKYEKFLKKQLAEDLDQHYEKQISKLKRQLRLQQEQDKRNQLLNLTSSEITGLGSSEIMAGMNVTPLKQQNTRYEDQQTPEITRSDYNFQIGSMAMYQQDLNSQTQKKPVSRSNGDLLNPNIFSRQSDVKRSGLHFQSAQFQGSPRDSDITPQLNWMTTKNDRSPAHPDELNRHLGGQSFDRTLGSLSGSRNQAVKPHKFKSGQASPEHHSLVFLRNNNSSQLNEVGELSTAILSTQPNPNQVRIESNLSKSILKAQLIDSQLRESKNNTSLAMLQKFSSNGSMSPMLMAEYKHSNNNNQKMQGSVDKKSKRFFSKKPQNQTVKDNTLGIEKIQNERKMKEMQDLRSSLELPSSILAAINSSNVGKEGEMQGQQKVNPQKKVYNEMIDQIIDKRIQGGESEVSEEPSSASDAQASSMAIEGSSPALFGQKQLLKDLQKQKKQLLKGIEMQANQQRQYMTQDTPQQVQEPDQKLIQEGDINMALYQESEEIDTVNPNIVMNKKLKQSDIIQQRRAISVDKPKSQVDLGDYSSLPNQFERNLKQITGQNTQRMKQIGLQMSSRSSEGSPISPQRRQLREKLKESEDARIKKASLQSHIRYMDKKFEKSNEQEKANAKQIKESINQASKVIQNQELAEIQELSPNSRKYSLLRKPRAEGNIDLKNQIRVRGQTSPISELKFNLDTDLSQDALPSFRQMFLNAIPTQDRREQTKSQIKMAKRAKAAELERLRADFEASFRAESEKLEKVRQRRLDARNRSTDILQERKALMDMYTPTSKSFVLKRDAIKREQELEEQRAREKQERLRAEKQRMLDNFRAKFEAMARNWDKGKDASRAESAEVSLEQAMLFEKIEARRIEQQRQKEEEFKHTAEGVKQYAARKRRELEMKRDKKYKALLNFGRFLRRDGKLLEKNVMQDQVLRLIADINRQATKNNFVSLADTSQFTATNFHYDPIRELDEIIESKSQSSIATETGLDSDSIKPESHVSLKEIAGSKLPYQAQDDKVQALEFNGKGLPQDYLLAKLSFKDDLTRAYQRQHSIRNKKLDLRLNSEFQFAKADVHNSSQCSFNQELESDVTDMHELVEIESGLDDMVQEFVYKSDFLQGVKDNNKMHTKQRTEASITYQEFVKGALDHGHLPLPILLKIKKGILYIPSSYTVTEGLAFAIQQALREMNNPERERKNVKFFERHFLSKAIFDKNNMNDTVFQYVLKGLKKCKDFMSLNSVSNEIGDASAKQICKLLYRPKFKNAEPEPMDTEKTKRKKKNPAPKLQELILVSNKCTPSAMDSIMNSLRMSTSLKSLTLQDMNLSERQFKGLINYIGESKTLSELDISWNALSCHHIIELFNVLERNRTIKYLNLAHLKMHNGEALAPHFEKFTKFVKENNQLTHLNLTSVDLPGPLMAELIHNIKRSISLHVVHLCGNKLGDEAPAIMKTRLKPTMVGAMIPADKTKLDLIDQVNQSLRDGFRDKAAKIYDAVKVKETMIEWLSVQQSYQKEEFPDPKNQNVLNGRGKGQEPLQGPQVQNDFFKPMILHKHLGHPEIHNAKEWKISNECWMCDKWRYTYIFWNTFTGEKFQIKDPALEERLQKLIYDSNKKFTSYIKNDEKLREDKAFITGSFTNWEPRRMLQIDELCAYLQNEQGALLDYEKRRQYANEVKDIYLQVLKEHNPYKDDTQFVNYPDAAMMGNKLPKLTHNRLFVYCDFIKPGQHQYIVSYETTLVEPEPPKPKLTEAQKKDLIKLKKKKAMMKEDIEAVEKPPPPFIPHRAKFKMLSYHQFLATAHLGQYNRNIKESKFSVSDRRWSKEKSVFKDWQMDRPRQIQEGFMFETQYWKVPAFVKDQEEVKEVQQYMKQNSEYLKTLFMILAAKSNFPTIKWLAFGEFINELKITDKKFEMSTVDRIFISVVNNVAEDAKQYLMADKDMSRFQFYESLVRIAFQKYRSSGAASSVTEAMKMLLEEHLMPTYNNDAWMQWRQDNIWQLDIDDLLKSNLVQFTALYQIFFKVKKKKNFFLDDAIELFCKIGDLNLQDQDIRRCWGLSKITVENDLKQRDKYQKATLLEFLELFCRVAEQAYKDSYLHKNAPLKKKVEMLMDEMFQYINMPRSETVIEMDYHSISEDELVPEQYYLTNQERKFQIKDILQNFIANKSADAIANNPQPRPGSQLSFMSALHQSKKSVSSIQSAMQSVVQHKR